MDLALTFGGCHRRGGVERSVWELSRHIAEEHDVTVYACDIDPLGLDRVKKVHVPGPRTDSLAPIELHNHFRQALRGHRHDHVVSFGNDGYGADVKWVNSIHRAWIRTSRRFPGDSGLARYPALRYASPRHLSKLAIERSYFSDATTSLVVAVAQVVADELGELYRVPAHITRIVHNGFSPDEFSPERRERLREEARGEFGYGADDVVMLMAANELGRKGLGTVLRAQARLGDPRLKLLVVGRAPLTDVHEEQIRALGLEAQVVHGGSASDMGRIHAASDLFVLPTQYEAFCLAIIEALASGLPVITTDVPGANDRIVDGVNGRLLSDPSSDTELADVLSEATDPAVRAKWSAGAPGSVADLTWRALAQRATELLQSVPSLRVA